MTTRARTLVAAAVLAAAVPLLGAGTALADAGNPKGPNPPPGSAQLPPGACFGDQVVGARTNGGTVPGPFGQSVVLYLYTDAKYMRCIPGAPDPGVPYTGN